MMSIVQTGGESRFTISSHNWPIIHADFFLELLGLSSQEDTSNPDALTLWTCRLLDFPVQATCFNQPMQGPAERLPSHRRLYLTYEGEVSNQRGVIKILDHGMAMVEGNEESVIVIKLRGNQIRGKLMLDEKIDTNVRWNFTPE